MWQIRECRETDFDRVLALLKKLWPTQDLDPTNGADHKLSMGSSHSSSFGAQTGSIPTASKCEVRSRSIKVEFWTDCP
jgi:hypothetical protein